MAALATAAVLAAATPARAQLAATGMVCTQDGMQCRYWMPVGYDAAKKYPLVLYFHGAGQAGADNRSQVEDWGNMPGAMLDEGVRAKFPAFFVAPQAPSSEGNDRWVNWDWSKGSYDIDAVAESASMKKALAILASLRAKYSVDPDRIYVMGESMGGFGAWDAITRHPDVFAAAVPTDGGGSPRAAGKVAKAAILSAHYDGDGAVPVSSDQEMYAAVTLAGGRQTFLQIAADSHGVAGTFAGNPDYFDWLFAQRRGTLPTAQLPFLAFSNPGGASGGPVTVTITTSAGEGSKIRYSLDGSLPTETTGMAYTGPVQIKASAILQAAAFSPGEERGMSVFRHAAAYVIAGVAIPGVDVGTQTGGAGSSATAGASAGKGGGAAGAAGSGAAGSAGAGGQGGSGVAGGGSAGAPQSGRGGEGGQSGASGAGGAGGGEGSSRTSGGCSLAPIGAHETSRGLAAFCGAALCVLLRSVRRRRR